MTMLTETRERFLRAIASEVAANEIAEIHFFSPIRQGGVESGVAVVAAWPGGHERVAEEGVADEPVAVEGSAVAPVGLPAEHAASTDRWSDEAPIEATAERDGRHVVYTARYLLTLKGQDRGKWESSVVAEADAPLVTVDAVVRGVQRRSGDVDSPTRMDGDEVRALLTVGA